MNCITSVTYSSLSSGFAAHSHDEHELILLCSGTALFRTSAGEQLIRAPSLVSIGHLEKHAVTACGEYERYVVTLRPEQLSAGSERLQMFFAPQFQTIGVGTVMEPLQTLFRLLLEEFRRGEEPADGMVWLLESALLLLYRSFPQYFPAGTGVAQTVRAAQNILERDLSRKIALDELAGQLHISVWHLSHSFKAITGYGVLQYRQMVRLAAACELLAQTDESISAVCEKSGFSDASGFARQFRKSLGCTPREYRRQFRRREDS
ncbi:MAG: AraC family transcriptional regulator [Firmicutes bacterium]|nr:AraC family transcriptional regulator [Bacillota bacterium]